MSPDTMGNPQLELQEKGVIDSGCSRHMTGNKSYLSDYEEIDGGFVAFGGDPKGGRITGKDTECVVLSPDFKLLDENHILLKVPRKDNMYSVDLKNIIPSGCWITNVWKTSTVRWKKTRERIGEQEYITYGSLMEMLMKGPFVVYSTNRKAYMVFTLELRCIDDPNIPNLEEIIYSDDDEEVGAEAEMNNLATNVLVSPIPTIRVHKDHSLEQIIGDIHLAPQTRRMTKNVSEHEAMQDELLQFKLQKVWTLVDLPYGKRAIGTKWVYKNKKDDRGIVVRNKVRLVAQGYTQEEGINYDKVFSPIARIEAIRNSTTRRLSNSCAKGFDFMAIVKANNYANSTMKQNNVAAMQNDVDSVIDETVIKEWEDRMERAATTASSLEAEQDSGNINRTQSMATLNESFPQGTNSGSGPRCQDTILGGAEAQIRFEAASKQSNDPPLSRVNTLGSGEDSMKLKELMEFCTKLSVRAFDL
ncbi:putative ribonuclease H-like domain-containing protein [Tanacetum coccineum]